MPNKSSKWQIFFRSIYVFAFSYKLKLRSSNWFHCAICGTWPVLWSKSSKNELNRNYEISVLTLDCHISSNRNKVSIRLSLLPAQWSVFEPELKDEISNADCRGTPSRYEGLAQHNLLIYISTSCIFSRSIDIYKCI